MKVLVCGGRDFTSREAVYATLDHLHLIHHFTSICHGAAKGADRLAGDWARDRGLSCMAFVADWQNHGLSAGLRRNKRMLKEFKPDLVIAFPGGTGTAHMVGISKKTGVRVITHEESVTQPWKVGRAWEIMAARPEYKGL